jgi:hypothetical protein
MKTTLFKTIAKTRLIASLPLLGRGLGGGLVILLLLLLAVSGCNDGYDPWVDPDALDSTGSTSTDVERYTGHPPGVPRLRGVNVYSSDFTQAALDTLISWNVNHLRWNMDMGAIVLTSMTPYMGQIKQECEMIKRWLPQLEKAGIYIAVTMEKMPGGRHETDNYVLVCTKQEYEDTFVAAWEYIAETLKEQKAVWAYELSNEPGVYDEIGNVGEGLLAWMPLCRKASKAIRTKDPDTAIMLWCAEDGYYEREFEGFDPDDVPNTLYTDHFYEPHSFSHQGMGNDIVTKYPNDNYNKEVLREYFKRRVGSIANPNYLHVYIGEWSAVRWAEGATQYYRDVLELMEEFGYDWAHFNFCLGGGTKRHLTPFSAIHGTNKDYMEYSEYERTPMFYEMLRWFKLNKH